MISAYASDGGRLVLLDQGAADLGKVVWFDLLTPTREEEALVEQALGIGVPLREEMEEIEISSRLYYEDGAAYMTATLPARTDTDDPHLAPVTFVLTGERLVSVRYHEPRAFVTLAARAQRVSMGCHNGESVLIALLEIQVDRLADVLERISREVAQISQDVFQQHEPKPSRSSNIQTILEAIGRKGDMTSNIRECLGSLGRMIGFFGQVTLKGKTEKELRTRIRTLSRDCQSIIDHASFLTQKVTFLLDATLGLINIEQNAIIKIFSVVAVVFLPPTLIASIYGMNFHFMPELSWPFGYPFAMLLMVLSAISPFWYFRRKGWL
jgi:magnesium transporter